MIPVMTLDRDRTFALDDETIVTIAGKPARLADLNRGVPFVVHLGDETVAAFRCSEEEHDATSHSGRLAPADVALHPGPFVLDRTPLDGTPIGGAA